MHRATPCRESLASHAKEMLLPWAAMLRLPCAACHSVPLFASLRTGQHVNEIRKGQGTLKHAPRGGLRVRSEVRERS